MYIYIYIYHVPCEKRKLALLSSGTVSGPADQSYFAASKLMGYNLLGGYNSGLQKLEDHMKKISYST